MSKTDTAIIMIDSCLLLVACMNLFSCINPTDKSHHPADIKSVNPIGYNLSIPDMTIIVPPVLREISGIAQVDSISVACVQDENGIVFMFDMMKNEIKHQFFFSSVGDYEGIARADSSLYVLRSDGVLFEILNYESSGYADKILSIDIPPAEYEGLCYDQQNDRLLIVPKSNPGKGSRYKKKHPVYEFNLHSEMPPGEPVFEFDLQAINKFAVDNNIIEKEGDNKIRFKPSAIGIHPLTKKLYVLSAEERMLFVFDMNGTIEYIEKLNPEIFNMPEGISFFSNGDMLISNEGRINPPTILRFNYTRK
jgi:hypothetical protein